MIKEIGIIALTSLNLNNVSKLLDNSFLKENNFYYESNDLIVKGNIENKDSSTYLNYIQNKDLLIFDINNKIDDSYFGFFYDYESNKNYYLETNSNDLINLKDDLKTFYNENNNINNNFISLASEISNNKFKELKSSTISKVAKPYGRMAFTYSLNEYEFSNITSLYLLEIKQQFICGNNCNENFEKGYERYYNNSEWVHVGAYQTSTEMGYDDIIKSGIPKFKDAYPVTKPSTVTINSSYQIGATLGYSFKNGISFDGISLEEDSSIGLNVNYGFSKSYTNTNPILSSQLGEDLSEFQWNYYFTDVDSATNYQVLGYLFECNRYQSGLDVHNKFGINFSAKATFSKKFFNDSHDVTFTKSIY